MHDLEIRGAGEILGDNQAGNIKVGFIALYRNEKPSQTQAW